MKGIFGGGPVLLGSGSCHFKKIFGTWMGMGTWAGLNGNSVDGADACAVGQATGKLAD